MDRKIYIILPVYNRINITRKFIENLASQTYQNFQLVLIDDGSTDGSADMVSKAIPNTVIIYGDGDLWWAGSMQKGYEWIRESVESSTDLVLIMNDDSIIEADFLYSCVHVMEKMDKCLLLAECYDLKSKELRDRGVFVDWRNYLFLQPNETKPVNCFSTRGLCMQVKDFVKIGGFYPRLLPHYLSDYEFTIRASKMGFKLLTHPDFYLFNDERETGIRDVENISFINSLNVVFSRKSAINPIHHSIFIILASPNFWILINLARVWKRMIIRLVKKMLGRNT